MTTNETQTLINEWRTLIAERISAATGMNMVEALAEADDHMNHGRPDADYLNDVML